jgi:2-hydroxychromene-2-carboxylate isomerase
MTNTITWYFDFISPFAYLQQARFNDFPKEIEIQAKPLLFAGLLSHWEHKGPAEIPAKRIFTYQRSPNFYDDLDLQSIDDIPEAASRNQK